MLGIESSVAITLRMAQGARCVLTLCPALLIFYRCLGQGDHPFGCASLYFRTASSIMAPVAPVVATCDLHADPGRRRTRC